MWKSIVNRYKTNEMRGEPEMLKTTSVAVVSGGEQDGSQFSLFCLPQTQSNFHGKELLSTEFCTESVEIADVTAGKHGGNKHSVAANERISPHKDSVRERVRLQIAACGWQGLTINELKVWHETRGRYRYPNELSPRLTELSASKQIHDSGRERGNCTVWVSDRRWVNGGAE